jgi:hypothetical protein
MWKKIVLCASLFGGTAAILARASRWMEPAALPITVAVGLCLIGVVLILAAPGAEPPSPPAVTETNSGSGGFPIVRS